ncbi:MAG: hypothetical protein PHE33_08310 [Bacteroidales bacterium]|nr:hypothetical protein [Bacteroidales bacterium]
MKNKNDEHNFEQLTLSDIYKISLDGNAEKWLESDIYTSISFSPDGNYVLVKTIEKPFSYLVPYNRFPSKTTIYTMAGKKVETVVEVPLIEDLPQGFMSVIKDKRNFLWRNDKPATLVYTLALDDGDPKNEVPFRDEVFEMEFPFSGNDKSILKTINRIRSIEWGNNTVAIAHDYWRDTRNAKTYIFNPSNSSINPTILTDRNYQEIYSDPGNFVTERNDMGSNVLALSNNNIYLLGEGFTEDGQFPFLDQVNLKNLKKKRIYQSKYTDKVETLQTYNPANNELLVRIESPTEYPNYYFRDVKRNELNQISFFANPFVSIQNVYKEVINYKRDDGLDLSGTLYLPIGYNLNNKEKMPMIMWAYPTEYIDKASAGQSKQNPNKFTYPYYGSMVY